MNVMDVKSLYDRVLAVRAEKAQIKEQLASALALNNKEGDDQALELDKKLDDVIAREEQLAGFYNKLVDEGSSANNLKKFVPITAEEIPDEDEKKKGTVTLAQYQNLSPHERLAFAKAGGQIVEGA